MLVSSGINFKKFIKSLYNQLGEFYDPNIKFWWTAECQFQLSILNNDLYYLIIYRIIIIIRARNVGK